MEFLWGLILGAVLGVVADRLWEHWESRPRVLIRPNVFRNVEGEGVGFSVQNVGKKELPPFDLVLFHPGRGSMHPFRSDSADALGPDIVRQFYCILSARPGDEDEQDVDLLHAWLHREQGQHVETVDGSGFVLRLQVLKSDRVLFESTTMGRRLVHVMLSAIQSGRVELGSWEENLQLRADTRWWLTRTLHDRRESRKTDEMIEAEGTSLRTPRRP